MICADRSAISLRGRRSKRSRFLIELYQRHFEAPPPSIKDTPTFDPHLPRERRGPPPSTFTCGGISQRGVSIPTRPAGGARDHQNFLRSLRSRRISRLSRPALGRHEPAVYTCVLHLFRGDRRPAHLPISRNSSSHWIPRRPKFGNISRAPPWSNVTSVGRGGDHPPLRPAAVAAPQTTPRLNLQVC